MKTETGSFKFSWKMHKTGTIGKQNACVRSQIFGSAKDILISKVFLLSGCQPGKIFYGWLKALIVDIGQEGAEGTERVHKEDTEKKGLTAKALGPMTPSAAR